MATEKQDYWWTEGTPGQGKGQEESSPPTFLPLWSLEPVMSSSTVTEANVGNPETASGFSFL